MNELKCPKCGSEMKLYRDSLTKELENICINSECDYISEQEQAKHQQRLDKVLSKMWTDFDYQHITIHEGKQLDASCNPCMRIKIKHHYGKLYLWNITHTGSKIYETEIEISLKTVESLLNDLGVDLDE